MFRKSKDCECETERRAREDAEYDQRRAEERADQIQRDARRQSRSAAEDYSHLSADYDAAQDVITELLCALKHFRNETQRGTRIGNINMTMVDDAIAHAEGSE